ncbi:MAG: RNA polymerase subunit sigma-70 [Planctomycetota bacterium]|nr:MAG: RNA polymerase subunit sigma-70 [Planctomycetota bacterium]
MKVVNDPNGTQAVREATRLLRGLSEAGPAAVDQLMPVLYDELRALAASYLRKERAGHTLEPTALVNEVYVRLAGQANVSWSDRAHFMALAAKAMRNTLVNHAEARAAEKRGGGVRPVLLSTSILPSKGNDIDTMELHEALTRLGALDARKVQVVEMRFFGGMTVEEIAHVLGVSTSTVEADWRMARAWLSSEMANE